MVVQSLHGRDSGSLYVICDVLDGSTVSVADGKKRTLASPKKKNIKHLRLTPVNIEDGGIYAPWDRAFDNRIAHFLKTLKNEQADNDKSED